MNFSDVEKQILARQEFQVAIEKFSNLIQQNKRVFLIGAGCSKCADLPLMLELTEKILNDCKGSDTGKILDHVRDSSENKGTIEDYLSELIDYLAIGERRGGLCEDSLGKTKIKIGDEEYDCTAIRKSIEEVKDKIKLHLDKTINIEIHRKFIQHVHNTIRPGKKTTRENIDYIILNYDTLFEDALAFENIEYVDGFKGGVSAYWDSATFDNLAYAKIIKLHGSIDWLIFKNDYYPRRINSKVKLDSLEAHSILIYPASTKYIETSIDPFAKLFEIARLSLRTDKEQQKVLVSIGYSFGDLHVNKEIENALIRSDGHLTLIVFIRDENHKLIAKWRTSSTFKDNVIVYSQKGVIHGDKEIAKLAVDEFIEWWKFEKLTNLLRGEL